MWVAATLAVPYQFKKLTILAIRKTAGQTCRNLRDAIPIRGSPTTIGQSLSVGSILNAKTYLLETWWFVEHYFYETISWALKTHQSRESWLK